MTGTALAAQQQALRRAIVFGDAVPGLLRELPGREPLLSVYRQAYTGRLVAALRENYSVLPQVLGDDGFDALARAYVAAQPSRRPSIRWFGDRLGDFMAGLMAQGDERVPHPALTDLARMEWALRTAFDAADATPLGAAQWAAVPADAWPQLVFEPLPSVQWIALEWNVEPVWRALQDQAPDGDDPPPLPEPVAWPHHLLVWRDGLATRWRSLDGLPAALLEAALGGASFGALGELAAQADGDADAAALQVAGALRRWADDGLFSAWRGASGA